MGEDNELREIDPEDAMNALIRKPIRIAVLRVLRASVVRKAVD